MSRRGQSATVARMAEHLRSGDPGRAERAGRAVLKREPRNPDAWHLHAMAALEAGHLAKARTRLERAIAIRPDSSVFHSNLGAVLERMGELESSYRAHDRALDLDRGPADNWFNHGLVLLRLDRPAEAAASLRAAMRPGPGRRGDPPEPRAGAGAVGGRGRAPSWSTGPPSPVRRVPASAGPPRSGKRCGACSPSCFRSRRLRMSAGCSSTRGWGRSSAPRPPRSCGSGRRLRRTMRRWRASSPRAAGCSSTICGRSSTSNRNSSASSPRRGPPACGSGPARGKPGPSRGPPGRRARIAAALAIQCFHNEYAWYAGPEEEALLAAPARPARPGPCAGPPPRPGRARRRPPARFPFIARRATSPARTGWPPSLRKRGLRRWRTSSITPCTVRATSAGSPASFPCSPRSATRRPARCGRSYEENPYPRWLSLPPGPGPDLDLGEALARTYPDRPPRGRVETVLVAGGGTGYEPLLAARQNPSATVLSIDLSRTSLAYGARMARRLGIGNVRFLQGDLLDVDALGETETSTRSSQAGCCTTWRTRRPGSGPSPGCFGRAGSSASACTASTPAKSSRRRARRRRRRDATAPRTGSAPSGGRSSKTAKDPSGRSSGAPTSTP